MLATFTAPVRLAIVNMVTGNYVGGIPIPIRRPFGYSVDGAALAATRPPSCTRNWLYEQAVQRCATVDCELLVRPATRPPSCTRNWLYEQAVQRCATVDCELLVRPAAQPTVLGHALILLAGAALRYREWHDCDDPPWALIGASAPDTCSPHR